MAYWEHLQTYIQQYHADGSPFTVHDYADDTEIPVWEASNNIQSHQAAQRAKDPRPAGVIYRLPGTRTVAAEWAWGSKVKDVRAVTKAYYSDVHNRMVSVVVHDLERQMMLNPRARVVAESQISAIVDGVMATLQAVVNGYQPPEPPAA